VLGIFFIGSIGEPIEHGIADYQVIDRILSNSYIQLSA